MACLRFLRFFLVAVAFMAPCGAAASSSMAVGAPADGSTNSSAPGPLTGFIDSYSVAMVLVPVVVRSPSGFVAGLERDAFRLRVAGRSVPIETFEKKGSAPLSLVVLQDLSGSMAQLERMDASRRALSCLLDQALPGDELALASFAGGRTLVEVPFTGEHDTLREAMALWEPYGTTALYDAVAWLPEIIAAGHQGRRAALLVTDGVDNQSALSPETAREIVGRAELPVYVLGLRGPRPKAPTSPGDFTDSDLLRLLATATGGRYHDVSDLDQVPGACASILTELRNQYVLGFSVRGQGESAYFPIQVEVGRSRGVASLVHRRGYHGTPPRALELP